MLKSSVALAMVLSAILMMMKGGQSVYCKFMTMLEGTCWQGVDQMMKIRALTMMKIREIKDNDTHGNLCCY